MLTLRFGCFGYELGVPPLFVLFASACGIFVSRVCYVDILVVFFVSVLMDLFGFGILHFDLACDLGVFG